MGKGMSFGRVVVLKCNVDCSIVFPIMRQGSGENW